MSAKEKQYGNPYCFSYLCPSYFGFFSLRFPARPPDGCAPPFFTPCFMMLYFMAPYFLMPYFLTPYFLMPYFMTLK